MEHGTWIGVSLEWLAILNVVDKQKKDHLSTYWKREKDGGKGA
jgi:hypothetical protein